MAIGKNAAGPRALRAWMKKGDERTLAALAEAAGVTPQAVYAWSLGHSRPRPTQRLLLQEVTDIPEGIWESEGERASRAGLEDAIERARRVRARLGGSPRVVPEPSAAASAAEGP